MVLPHQASLHNRWFWEEDCGKEKLKLRRGKWAGGYLKVKTHDSHEDSTEYIINNYYTEFVLSISKFVYQNKCCWKYMLISYSA